MLHVREWGETDRPLVILLHAVGCHGSWWDWVGPLLGRRYRAVAVDLPGHGESPRADDYSYAAAAAAVEDLAGSLGGGPYALVGHSMGGYVGLEIANRGVRPPASLIVADMKFEATPEELAALHAAAAKPGRLYGTLEEAAGRYRLSPPQHRVPAEVLAKVAADSYHQREDGAWEEKMDRRALAIGPLRASELAAGVRCRTLFVRGELSQMAPAEETRALARAAGANLLEMPGLYHHLPLEDPEGLAALIERFLA